MIGSPMSGLAVLLTLLLQMLKLPAGEYRATMIVVRDPAPVSYNAEFTVLQDHSVGQFKADGENSSVQLKRVLAEKGADFEVKETTKPLAPPPLSKTGGVQLKVDEYVSTQHIPVREESLVAERGGDGEIVTPDHVRAGQFFIVVPRESDAAKALKADGITFTYWKQHAPDVRERQ